MSWAQEQAVQLFNEAKLAGDAAQKLRALQQLSELLFQKEPALLSQFGFALLELQAEPAAPVRKFLASKLEELAAGGAQFVQPCAAAAVALSRDAQSSVAKRALLSATGVLRLAVTLACSGAVRPEAPGAWAAARALCAEACALASRAQNEGVRLQAIKLVEASALMLSAALGAPGVAPGGVERGISAAAAASPATPAELRDCLMASLGALTAQPVASVATSGPVALVQVDAVGSLARQRVDMLPLLMPWLLSAGERAAGAEGSAQAASLAHAVKAVLVQLLRSGALQAGAWQERAVAALAALGQQAAADAALRQLERSTKRERAQLERDQDPAYDDEDAPAPAAKRAFTEPLAASNGGDASPGTDAGLLAQVVSALAALAAGGDHATLSSFVAQLTPAVLADVVLLNMRHLPAVPPPPAHGGADAAAPGLMALFSNAAAPAAAPAAVAPAAAPQASAPAPAPAPVAAAAPAPPAPLVAQQLGAEVRAAQRLAAAKRILHGDDRKNVTAASGDAFRCAVLARVGAVAEPRFREELLEFLLDDYAGRQGHALLIQWLYCIFADELAPQPVRKSAYDAALLAAARGVLRKLSARDRALPQLFVDAPALPAAALGVLEWLVGLADEASAEPASLEQRTLGLITLRDIVMHRAPERAACLQLVLRCTVHSDDALRSKAIRMVINQLHPLPFCVPDVEQYASDRLASVQELPAAGPDDEGASEQACIDDALRRISLYFALCTRKDALLPRLFSVFAASDAAAQPAFHRNMAGLARTLGPQSETLLRLIAAPPAGAEALTLQAFQALCDTGEPIPPALLQVGRDAYAATERDVRFLLPVLHALPREELRALLPQIVALPPDDVLNAFRRILEVAPGATPAMSAAEIVIALHGIDPARDSVPLKQVMDACSACFAPQLRDVFTPDALAVALQQLVEQVPLPLLFMRTVIQTATVATKLHGFILDLLSKLVLKQVWKSDAKLWQGVLRCAKQMVPRSFPVYLQLPDAQLRDALAAAPDLVAPLAAYAATPAVRSSVPGATLAVLASFAPADEA